MIMYYPYLRGKQFELLALRDFAKFYSTDNRIMPIIEPVKATFNSMKIAIKIMQEKNMLFALILNPQAGAIKNRIGTITIEENLVDELADRDTWIPAFIVNNNHDEIAAHITEKRYNRVMLIRKRDSSSDDDSFERLASNESIKTIVIDPAFKGTKRRLRDSEKKIIRLDDNFQPQQRNSDYVGLNEELFSQEYRYYEDESFNGISDYTVLPSTFIEGGRLPYAIAIHMTYEKSNDEIYVKHFVSDTNDDSSNIQGKFGEASGKAVAFFSSKKMNNYAISALKSYYESSSYPGLGMIKKISIMNHLELMNGVLKPRE